MPTSQQIQESREFRLARLSRCCGCHKVLPWQAFGVCSSRRPFGLSSRCKSCEKVRKLGSARRWYRNLTEAQRRAHNRKTNLKKVHGVTLEQYAAMLAKQGNRCAICDKDRRSNTLRCGRRENLAIDHCHKTGRIRGLLCARCNKGVGLFLDSVIILEKAIAYLKAHSP